MDLLLGHLREFDLLPDLAILLVEDERGRRLEVFEELQVVLLGLLLDKLLSLSIDHGKWYRRESIAHASSAHRLDRCLRELRAPRPCPQSDD